MYRHASRSLLRQAQNNVHNVQVSSRRFLSTAPPHQKSRTWKSSAVRWGIAIAGVYYYNTSPLFAESTQRIMKFDSDGIDDELSSLPSVDAYAASRKQQQQSYPQSSATPPMPPTSEGVTADDPSALEEEASQQGAFNPETGEINWECSCLGGMAHGPCGEEFRAAFSCFIYSEQEPKGLECIEKFKGMQDCFRDHPDVYAAELEDDEAELDAELAKEQEAMDKELGSQQTQKRLLDDSAPAPVTKPAPQSERSSPKPSPSQSAHEKNTSSRPQSASTGPPTQPVQSERPPQAEQSAPTQSPTSQPDQTAADNPSDRAKLAKKSTEKTAEKFDEDLDLMPKAWHDGRSANEKTEGGKKTKS